MIEKVAPEDILEIRTLISKTVKTCIEVNESDYPVLLEDILSSLDWWKENRASALHLKCSVDGKIVGVVLIKNFRVVSNLFVLPEYHRKGIARMLMEEVIRQCGAAKPGQELVLNSSTYAVEFYLSLGFVSNGEPRPLPGGCVPLIRRLD